MASAVRLILEDLRQLGRPGAPGRQPARARQKHAFTVNVVRSAALENRPQALPYVAYVSSAYRSDIINELCQFFMDHNVELENLTCDTYQAPQTGGTMLNATFTVTLPAGVQISWLRDQFLDFADALNLDALIEPWRPQNPM